MMPGEAIKDFIDYVTLNDDGYWNGIRDDAPESAKKAYDDFMEKKKQAAKRGIKL